MKSSPGSDSIWRTAGGNAITTRAGATRGHVKRPEQEPHGTCKNDQNRSHTGTEKARATDETANRTKARATRDARTTRAGATRGHAKRPKPEGEGEQSDGRAGSWAGRGRDRRPDQMASVPASFPHLKRKPGVFVG